MSFFTWRRERDSNPRSVISRTHDFQSCALDQLSHLSMVRSTTLNSIPRISRFVNPKFCFFLKNLLARLFVPQSGDSKGRGRDFFVDDTIDFAKTLAKQEGL